MIVILNPERGRNPGEGIWVYEVEGRVFEPGFDEHGWKGRCVYLKGKVRESREEEFFLVE